MAGLLREFGLNQKTKTMKPKKRGRKGKLKLLKIVDSVKVCKQGSEKLFILPKGMNHESYSNWRQDNRNFLHKLKKRK